MELSDKLWMTALLVFFITGVSFAGTGEDKKCLMPPVATTPQTFNSGATVANLQAAGANIVWYSDPAGETPLGSTTTLVDGNIYFASQTSGLLESETRTAVRVIFDDNVVTDAPRITNPQHFCGSATLADIATGGNTNIMWFDAPVNGNLLPLTTLLVDGNLYYAAISAGGPAASPLRTEVEVFITNFSPGAPAVRSPQYFCNGATLANIGVPNNQIIWYDSPTGGSPVIAGVQLVSGDYYAAQRAGECESGERTKVTIIFDAPPAPVAPDVQVVCSGSATLADLMVTGGGIVWYDAPVNGNLLSLKTSLTNGNTYYAAQSSGSIEGARTPVKITFNCYTVIGTVFPFVNETDPDFNKLFPVQVKLFPVPAADNSDPVDHLQNSVPIHSVSAIYYDGTIFVKGPKNPGAISLTYNPGLPVNWDMINKDQGTTDNTVLTGIGDMPTSPTGLFIIKGVAEGQYILEIARKGYLTRWGKVTIDGDKYLGHRELLPGDIDGNLRIDTDDISGINARRAMIGTAKYDPGYDLNANGYVDYYDNSMILFYNGASVGIYQETSDWLNEYQ